MTEESLSEQLAAAAREMAGAHETGPTMDKVVQLALQLVPGAQEAGISLVHGDRTIDTPAASSDKVRRVDALQYEHDEGPCLDAIRESDVTESADIRADDRWPAWGVAAGEETGVRSMLAFRLFTQEGNYGALNLYSRRSHAFDEDDREHGLALAAHAAVAVASAQEIEQLRSGIRTRDLIGQAKGIVMERYDVDAGRAFALLVRVSSHRNCKLRDVAAELVQTRRVPGDVRGEAARGSG